VHDSLAFFDRREGMHFAATALTIPSCTMAPHGEVSQTAPGYLLPIHAAQPEAARWRQCWDRSRLWRRSHADGMHEA